MKLKNWLRDVGGKRTPEDEYVDSAEVPPEPEGPYRARMAASTHHAAPVGIDVNEREIVAGHVELFYRILCPCGHHWDSVEFQKMSLCPQCGRAVLVEEPTLPKK